MLSSCTTYKFVIYEVQTRNNVSTYFFYPNNQNAEDFLGYDMYSRITYTFEAPVSTYKIGDSLIFKSRKAMYKSLILGND
jgi:hypothetical protein